MFSCPPIREGAHELSEKTLVQKVTHDKYAAKLEDAEKKYKVVKIKEKFVADNARRYDDDPKFQLPQPKPMMSAKGYYEKVALPLVTQLKDVIQSILLQFHDKSREFKTALDRANTQVQGLSKRLKGYEAELPALREMEKDYRRLRRGLGRTRPTRLLIKRKHRRWRSGRSVL